LHCTQTALANSGAESIERRYKMPETVARGFHARIDMLLRDGFKRALTATLRIKPMSLPSTTLLKEPRCAAATYVSGWWWLIRSTERGLHAGRLSQ